MNTPPNSAPWRRLDEKGDPPRRQPPPRAEPGLPIRAPQVGHAIATNFRGPAVQVTTDLRKAV